MLSIVIPTLNEEKHIGKLLNCLKKQTFQDFEVIIADGNSTDNTKKAINSFNKFMNLTIINSEKRNVAFQRNLGAKNAKNEMILFLDADTSFDDYFLEDIIKETTDNNIKLAGCYLYPDSKNIIDILFFFLFRAFMKIFHAFSGLNGCCIFVLKSLHNKINGFDESIKVGEDYDYSCRLKIYTKINMLKNLKIRTSIRRFERNGRLGTGIKVVLIGLYVLFIGKIKTDIFRYRFN